MPFETFIGDEVPPKAGRVPAPPATPPPRDDPLDTTTELTTRVEALWSEWQRISADERELVRIPLLKGAIRTALIRAQRDAATRALEKCKAIITETMT